MEKKNFDNKNEVIDVEKAMISQKIKDTNMMDMKDFKEKIINEKDCIKNPISNQNQSVGYRKKKIDNHDYDFKVYYIFNKLV